MASKVNVSLTPDRSLHKHWPIHLSLAYFVPKSSNIVLKKARLLYSSQTPNHMERIRLENVTMDQPQNAGHSSPCPKRCCLSPRNQMDGKYCHQFPENKAVAILEQMQAGRPALIQKDGGEMLIAIVLDRPLADAKALVDDPAAFTQEMTRILLEKQSHPLIAQMIKPAGSSDPPPSHSAASSSGSHEHHSAGAPVQFQ